MSDEQIDDMVQQFLEKVECGECNQRLVKGIGSEDSYYMYCPKCGLMIRIDKIKLRVQMFELLKLVE